MSEQSSSSNVRGKHLLRAKEILVLRMLLGLADRPVPVRGPLDSLEVQELDDGGMGSLYFVHPSKDRKARGGYVARVADVQFADADGVDVLVSLNVDRDGELFELDVWRVDFKPVLDLALALHGKRVET